VCFLFLVKKKLNLKNKNRLLSLRLKKNGGSRGIRWLHLSKAITVFLDFYVQFVVVSGFHSVDTGEENKRLVASLVYPTVCVCVCFAKRSRTGPWRAKNVQIRVCVFAHKKVRASLTLHVARLLNIYKNLDWFDSIRLARVFLYAAFFFCVRLPSCIHCNQRTKTILLSK
jgi:hypothetical protein